ncbi:PQQ-binding-like beta-propeller repeat protein [Novosphingopyxis sp.]|uniref:outer membrane protein assembly factor BamB family protein n=1 Tax=Novosphingopyxis sp. TaxID=2709690 RepID=UPI003B5C82EE
MLKLKNVALSYGLSRKWPVATLMGAMLIFAGTIVHASAFQQQSTTAPSGHVPIETADGQIPGAAPSGTPNGEELYNARCAACHDNATDRTPSREVLSKNPASFILATMRNGAMAPMAEGLSTPEMAAIAQYVSVVKDDDQANADIDPDEIWGDGVEGTPLDAPKCSASAMPVDVNAEGGWNGWSPTKDNARFQRDPGLKPGDVPRLKLKWAFQYPGAKNGQATVLGDRLFVTSMSGAVYALNAQTGCVYWRHAATSATRTSVAVAAMPEGSPVKTALFFSDWSKSAVALDADTGEQLWKTVIDNQPGLQMTGSVTYWDGKLYVPISSGNEAFAQSPNWICCKFRGAVVALDAATGQVLWKRYTTDEVPKPFKKNDLGKDLWGPSGGAVWVTPTIDPERRLVYIGTSNSYTDKEYDNSDSVMALDADTGEVRWARQLTPDDNYIDGCYRKPKDRPANCPSPLGPDFSIGAAPILHDLAGGGQVLLVGQKSGMIYGLDPADDGAKLWERKLSDGSALGGIEFGTAADDTQVYAGVSDIAAPEPKRGDPGLWALDARTGEVVWNQPGAPDPKCRWKNWWCHGAISQAISVIPGVVFAGSYDGHFRAYDRDDGHVIWDVDTGSEPVKALNGETVYGGVMDGAGPTIANGMVYVHSGYAGRSGATAGRDLKNADGNVLMAFSVDGK